MKTQEIIPPSDLMDLSELSAYVRKSKPYLYRAMREQGLPGIRMGQRWMFSKIMVDQWIKALPGVNLPTAS